MYRYIFFDLDGTLTDSKEGVINSVRWTLQRMGAPAPEETTLLRFIGPVCRLVHPPDDQVDRQEKADAGGHTEAFGVRERKSSSHNGGFFLHGYLLKV